ncbi:MAG: hypothetical protein RIS89_1046 [Bacteroidota bacterium]|jgi:hypothetical protein
MKKTLDIVLANKLYMNDIDSECAKMVNKFLLVDSKLCPTTCNFIFQ